ncbi:DNA N-6-adenine-methyltransferase [Vulgatibacter sp.]|uniref:DNA N-6-adenine-methyltransferase n=1 Tax=Vulgatibacter sp. TaxID=1971226 RepID=UPI003564F05B
MNAAEGNAAVDVTAAAEPRERTNNDLTTPIDFLEPLAELGKVYLDPCSNEWSIVGAEVELDGSSPERDGLFADWKAIAAGRLVFVNPPYGRGHLRPWARKIVQAAAAGCEIVVLIPVSPSTLWWQTLRQKADAMVFLHQRLSFGGGKHGTGQFDSAAFYFGRRPYLFAHAFQQRGDVVVFR